jgi:hypothetical protein
MRASVVPATRSGGFFMRATLNIDLATLSDVQGDMAISFSTKRAMFL